MADTKASASDKVRILIRVDIPNTRVEDVAEVHRAIMEVLARFSGAMIEISVLPSVTGPRP
jgi:ribosome maturation factor RimP